MAIDDPELSPTERGLVAELGRLTADPDPQRRARILAAARHAPGPPPIWVRGPWRATLTAAAAVVVILAVSSVGAVAASRDALPSSPTYPLRTLGDNVQLTFADPPARERLRIAFAQARIVQAQAALRRGDRSDARGLLRDSGQYLQQAQQAIGNVPPGEQGQVQNQLDSTLAQQDQAQGQLNQQGGQGQNGG